VKRRNAPSLRFCLSLLLVTLMGPVLTPGLGAAAQRERSASSSPEAAGRAELAPGDIALISTSDESIKGNGLSENPAIPVDASKVAFRSEAANLDPMDSDRISDEYVKDVVTGDLTLVSTSGSGNQKSNGYSANPVFSADGTTVAFRSAATNLVIEDTDTVPDIYVKSLMTGEILLASTSDSGVKGNNGSYNPFLSEDGTKVAFRSAAKNLDPLDLDAKQDVYVKDVTTGDITLASVSRSNKKGNGSSGNPALSADGTKVAFYSDSTNLASADQDSTPDIFVKDLTTGVIVLASTSSAGVKGNGKSVLPYLSSDGTKVAFISTATNLHPGDTDIENDVYLKDLVTGELMLVSVTEKGRKGNAHSESPYLSGDATRVAFRTGSTNLDPGDTDALQDIYVKDLSTGDVILVSTSSEGIKGNGVSGNPALSADGSLVAFYSASTNLHPEDGDTLHDIYLKAIDDTADLSVAAVDTPDPVPAGGTLTYTMTLTNMGPASATNVELTQTLPSSLEFVSASTSQGSGCVNVARTVTCGLGALGRAATAQAIVETRTTQEGTVLSVVGVRAVEPDPDPSNNESEMTTIVEPAADLALTTEESADPVIAGEELSYLVTILNNGPSTASDVVLTDTLAGSVGFATAAPSQGTCIRPERVFMCSLGTIEAGETATVLVKLKTKREGRVTNVASIRATEADLDEANNTSKETTTVLPA
jgi:uncharacterized repeat protein (TIGR01451 family)